MKKLISLSLFSSCILFISNPIKADWDKVYIVDDDSGGYNIYTVNNASGEYSLRTSKDFGNEYNSAYFDDSTKKLHFRVSNQENYVYDLDNNIWERSSDWTSDISSKNGEIIDRYPPIRRDGQTISIGDNSLKLKETDTEQQLWGTNADGEIVPINITNGSKLLINGRDVEQSINNVGALSAALTGLPTVPTNTNLACGLGTGTHGGDFAFSGGCASKVNEKLSVNYAASMTMPGQDYAGNFEDKFSARAGFVWQLGEANKPTKISLKDQTELEEKIKKLEAKNEKVISQNAKLLERLENLENIAFKFQEEDKYKLSKSISE